MFHERKRKRKKNKNVTHSYTHTIGPLRPWFAFLKKIIGSKPKYFIFFIILEYSRIWKRNFLFISCCKFLIKEKCKSTRCKITQLMHWCWIQLPCTLWTSYMLPVAYAHKYTPFANCTVRFRIERNVELLMGWTVQFSCCCCCCCCFCYLFISFKINCVKCHRTHPSIQCHTLGRTFQ